MQIFKCAVILAVLALPGLAFSQSTTLPLGSEDYHFLERMEIKQQTNNVLNFSNIKPFFRNRVVKELLTLQSRNNSHLYPSERIAADTLNKPVMDSFGLYLVEGFREGGGISDLSAQDQYNLDNFLRSNREWVPGEEADLVDDDEGIGSFYSNKANLLEVNGKDFFLAVNPVFQYKKTFDSKEDENIFYSSRGVSLRGRIANRIGFSTYLTDNQERGPLWFRNKVSEDRAVPGAGFIKVFKETGRDYFDARGSFTFGVTKYINVEAGYDKNFIGDGYRSLFLSDFSSPNLFVKLNTSIWRIQYENLFMELNPTFVKRGDNLLDRKYAAMHKLTMNVTPWMNIGLFEGIIFGRKNRFDFQYLNPIIFLRHVEGFVGSPDNAVAGFDMKVNIARRAQFYGQFLLDEFKLSEIKNDPTNWVNKWGFQAGLKYIDVAGINNLDLQVETNRVRPFTYSHYDSVANYAHYNQPLAHPLGANFQEWIGIVRYQPIPRLFLEGKAIYYKKGLDASSTNDGGDIFKLYTTRAAETGFKIGRGFYDAQCLNIIANASYELWDNLFIDAAFQNRQFVVKNNTVLDNTTTNFSLGLRLNMAKREYDY